MALRIASVHTSLHRHAVAATPGPRTMNTSTHRPTVLVLGANGRFGLAAAQAFDAAGWTVIAHVRRDAAAGMPAAARLVRGDLAGLAALLAGDDAPNVVVHALNPIYTRWDEEALPVAHAGMDLAERLGARFMLPGNVYNFGAGMPDCIKNAFKRGAK